MSSDLHRLGYKRTDVFRIYGFNLILLPVNLAGTLKSLQQAAAKSKIAFARTPKVKDRTAAPALYVLAAYLIAVFSFGPSPTTSVAATGATRPSPPFNGLAHHVRDRRLHRRAQLRSSTWWLGMAGTGCACPPRPRRRRRRDAQRPRPAPRAGSPSSTSVRTRTDVHRTVSQIPVTRAPPPAPRRDPRACARGPDELAHRRRRVPPGPGSRPLRVRVSCALHGPDRLVRDRDADLVRGRPGRRHPGPTCFSRYVDVTNTPAYPFETPPGPAQSNVTLAFVVSGADDRCAPRWGGAYTLDAASSDLDLDRRISQLRLVGGQRPGVLRWRRPAPSWPRRAPTRRRWPTRTRRSSTGTS